MSNYVLLIAIFSMFVSFLPLYLWWRWHIGRKRKGYITMNEQDRKAEEQVRVDRQQAEQRAREQRMQEEQHRTEEQARQDRARQEEQRRQDDNRRQEESRRQDRLRQEDNRKQEEQRKQDTKKQDTEKQDAPSHRESEQEQSHQEPKVEEQARQDKGQYKPKDYNLYGNPGWTAEEVEVLYKREIVEPYKAEKAKQAAAKEQSPVEKLHAKREAMKGKTEQTMQERQNSKELGRGR